MRSFLVSSLLFALYTVQAAPSDEPESLEDRIINGFSRTIQDDPWMVSLNDKTKGNKHFCGGALIDPQWVLTAAHCVYDKDTFDIELQMGTTHLNDGGEFRNAIQVTRAPEHGKNAATGMHVNDLALIKMNQPVDTSGPYIRTIGLWPWKEEDFSWMIDQQLWMPGWGTTSANGLDSYSNSLNLGYTRLMGMDDCKNTMKNLNYAVGDDVICGKVGSGGVDVCTGDSGGPAILYYYNHPYVVGVVSGGVAGCGHVGAPILFAEVAQFYNWIVGIVW